jgi:endonuclease-3 related protein
VRLIWRRATSAITDRSSARVRRRLLGLYDALLGRFGAQGWWPARTPFEVAVGAILAQNTSWRNVERALANLKARRLLTPPRLAALPAGALARLIRPSGYFRVKARRLRAFLRYLAGRGSLRRLRGFPLEALREELLEVPGIGPETADSILLYALDRPVFVVDAYTRRILSRHRLVPRGIGYEALRAFFERHLPRDPRLFNEYHALLVAVAKAHCGSRPRCEGCPLAWDLRGRPPRR